MVLLQAQLFKSPHLPSVRPTLQHALLAALVSTLWEPLYGDLLHVLVAVSATDWAEFVERSLPSFCQQCGPAVAARQAALIQPFTDRACALDDSSHLSHCVGSFVNDVRFFARLGRLSA